MTCIIAEHLHLRESSSAEALQKLAARNRGAWMISDVLKIKGELRSCAVQTTTIILPMLLITHRPMACHKTTSHPSSKGHRQYILQFMNCHHLHRPLRQRSTRLKTESRETASIIRRHRLLPLESLNGRQERWMLTRIMMTMGKRIRRVALSQRRDLGQDLHLGRQRLHLLA
jgi:hypothetical protein